MREKKKELVPTRCPGSPRALQILAWVCAYLGNSAAFDEAQALAFATVITEAIYGGDAHRDGGGVRALF